MTNMPGSGNGGYGGGWTPPTPGQQPGAGGPRNAYGQPIAQPSQAPAGNYPPRQPGTNAYGQPVAPQQPQVPPTIPPQPGTNGYGQPMAPQQPAAMPPSGYGPPPGPNGYGQPAAPAKGRKPLLIVFAIVVVVAIVGAAGWTFLNTGSSSGPDSAATAGDAVKGYLEALSRGDANAALAFSDDQPASKDFLTDDILKQQTSKWPITNIRILSDSSASGGNSAISFGQVHVAVNFGDKTSDTNLSVKKQDSHWRLDRAAVKLEANSSGIGNQAAANTLTLFGKPLNGNAAYVFPGFLDIASNNQNITATTKNPVLLDQLATAGSGASLQPTYTVTDAAKTAIMAQVKAITDACTNSHLAVPPKPCDAVAFGVVDGTVNWGPADLSRIKIDNIDNYSSAGLTVRVSGQAFFNNVTGTDQWNGGGTKTLNQQSMYINGSVDLTKTPLTLSQK
ncbi:DUF4878 domain-containing protein [Mycobacterium sp. CBMA293]|uniref:Lumazine-binding domain protein n=1 Tax=Mycolicibacterium sp. CBMA 213 TaxID=1968788 RepID=A0A1S6GKJ1_9MYCO|nr:MULTISPECIES: DUF4878 domain-containing protein [unclassified Mycolicibacterium]AQS22385.1 Lumazine-binding domain protein [Mycolicibacterium sp. CBMA 213]MUL48446.1 DUF4878 domain-containing protein [Mycolicibacterium sp. CBMA 360]MUL62304.1 DUF4878 domain-containing protein [Mycolicibacterium sp. CBMA 335]MUM04441.1 hypothetical protein [Mycolicibacterium sp. CBMA 213]MUM14704.1 DUF4878 domain-containing protein [Mycolicibacterium sp. CBMA 293]